MVYVPSDLDDPEAADTDSDSGEPSGRPVDPDAVEDADLDDLRERVAALTRTVEHLATRGDDSLSPEEVVEVVIDQLEQCGALADGSLDGHDDRTGLDEDGGTSRGFY